MSAAKTITLALGPGQIMPVDQPGENFCVVLSPCGIEIEYPGAEFCFFEQGNGLDSLPGSGTFARLQVRNPSLNDIRVILYIGGPLYRAARMAVIEPDTEKISGAIASIGAGATITIAPDLSGNRIRRKAVTLSNGAAASRLMVLDDAGDPDLILFPETNITLPVSKTVKVNNPNGAAVEFYYSEIYWVTD